MFTFEDRKGRSISLRPEATAGVIRAYIDNNLAYQPGVKKLYYFGPMFRAERPQKGRYREFYQFGTEAIGSSSPMLDAEVIQMNLELFSRLGLKNLKVKINSVGCNECRKAYLDKLQNFLMERYDKLCEDCKIRSKKNPLRVFDCKNESCQAEYKEAPRLIDELCDKCSNHFKDLKTYLNDMGIEYIIDTGLVRGFDYYTRTVFEITSSSLGAQNALLGGGRYDYLVEQLGGQPTPAVGAAAGVERVILALNEQNVSFDLQKQVSLYVVVTEEVPTNVKIKLFEFLRQNGIATYYSYNNKGLRYQLNEANKYQVDYTLIIGDDEIKNKFLTLKNMKEGSQEKIKIKEITAPSEVVNTLSIKTK